MGNKNEIKNPIFSRVFFLCVWFIIPLLISSSLQNAYNDPKMPLYIISGFIMLALYFFNRGKYNVTDRKAEFSAAVFFILMLLSLIDAGSRIEGARALVFWGSGISLMLFFMIFQDRKTIIQYIPFITAIIILLCSVYAFFQYWGYDFLTTEYKNMPVSTFGNLNYAAQYLVAVIPLLIAASARKKNFIFFSISLALAMIYLLITQSRGGYIAFFVSVIFSLIIYGIKLQKQFNFISSLKTSEALLKTVIIFCGISIILFTINYLDSGSTAEHFLSSFNSKSENNKFRILSYKSALLMSVNNPLNGVGIGNFKLKINQYKSEDLWHTEDSFSRGKLFQTHNDYLHLLTETGFPGLLCFLALIFFVLKKGIGKILADKNEDWIITAGYFAGFIGILTHMLVDFPLFNPASAMSFWVFAGILASNDHCELKNEKSKYKTDKIRILYAASAVSILLSIVWLFMAGIPQISSSYNMQKGMYYFRNRDFGRSAVFFEKASLSDKYSADAAGMLGDAYRNMNNHDKAIEAYTKAIQFDPLYVPYHERMGFCYFTKNEYASAEKCYLEAVRINPVSVPNLLNLGRLYFVQKNYQSAAEYFEKAVKIDPEFDRMNLILLGESFYNSGNFVKSYEYFKKAFGYMPDNIQSLQRLNELIEKIDMPDAEKSKYRTFLKISRKK